MEADLISLLFKLIIPQQFTSVLFYGVVVTVLLARGFSVLPSTLMLAVVAIYGREFLWYNLYGLSMLFNSAVLGVTADGAAYFFRYHNRVPLFAAGLAISIVTFVLSLYSPIFILPVGRFFRI